MTTTERLKHIGQELEEVESLITAARQSLSLPTEEKKRAEFPVRRIAIAAALGGITASLLSLGIFHHMQ